MIFFLEVILVLVLEVSLPFISPSGCSYALHPFPCDSDVSVVFTPGLRSNAVP